MAEEPRFKDNASTADLPPSKPSIEMDEASGRAMVTVAQSTVHTFGYIMQLMGKGLTENKYGEHIKIGFDFNRSMAYVELDMKAILYVLEYEDDEGDRPLASLSSDTTSFGHYDGPLGSGRHEFVSTDPDTVRLYIDNR